MRTPIELALSLRSYERVVCLTDLSVADRSDYPEHWIVPRTLRDAGISPETVVLVDRIYISAKVLGQIGLRCPRLIALGIIDVPHYKECRRLVKEVYPFAEMWDFNEIDLAKLLVTDARGVAYDRDRIMDMRPGAVA